MQKIVPCLWFDSHAEEAMHFYTSVFKNSKAGKITRFDKAMSEASGQPEGSVMTTTFWLGGYEFMGLNGGPIFKPTPAVSYFVNCDTEAEIDQLFKKLSAEGEILMPFQKYPFSEKYGWINDKYGVSWQLNLASVPHKIAPALLFVGDQFGKVEEAMNLYTGLFPNSGIETISRYTAEEGPEGAINYARFKLGGEDFVAMESNLDHKFTFTEANSFMVNCDGQEEIDQLWNTLTTGGEEQPCGWLKDKYGVSWQIVPTAWFEMVDRGEPEKLNRAMGALTQMKKIDIAALEEAYDQK